MNNIIPELVSCKVFKVEITDTDTDNKQIVSDIEKLINLGVYDRQENMDNNDIPHLFTYKSDNYEITGVEFGDRFTYAVKALKSVYDVDIEHEYAPNLFK